MLKILSILFITLTSLSTFAEANQEVRVSLDVEKWVLPNGLTVLFQEDHSVPLVSYHQWFRVGSKDEVVGRTGLAHFFEHLMFRGSKNFPQETFSRVLNSKGANFNAFTSTDYTGYYIEAPSSELDFIIKVEADRMRNLKINPETINPEREVVKEERRVRYENSPEGFQWIALPELMYKNLPYRWPTIGSMKDLNEASVKDFQSFYDEFYAPNNAVIVVAGDFDKSKTKKWIEAAYGDFQSQKIERPSYSPEPVQTKRKAKTIKWKVQSPIMTMAYHTESVGSKESYALEVLGSILGDGDSSRLHRKLVYHGQLATSVSAFSYAQLLAGRMIVIANLKTGVSSSKVRDLIQAELNQIQKSGVTDQELQKVKNQILTQQVGMLKSIGGRARALAYNEVIFGDYTRLFTDLESYLSVTNEDVQAVAKKYLSSNLQNIAIVQPE
ncbi:insulinase family protein [bacterium]|nr:insulinase family protein [bacterium]